ncbi:MAG: retropepsin-like aspartic protease [Dysgonomonas sp.]
MKEIFTFHIFIITCIFISITSLGLQPVSAQSKLPVIEANSESVIIKDGKYVEIDWKLNPKLKPDTYFVNIPFRESKVQFETDKDSLFFDTSPGSSYEFIVLLNKKDSCYIKIASVLPPDSVKMTCSDSFPIEIPFTLIGSRIYFKGMLNNKPVNIQLDLGAGTNTVNEKAVDNLQLKFTSLTLVSNTEGLSERRTSENNNLAIGKIDWTGMPFTEVGNMQDYEDLIIGNGVFRDKVIEIDYDRNLFVIHTQLPSKVKDYKKLPVYYVQNRPKFEAEFVHNNTRYDFWFLFDTGRDGTMLIGEDFTSKNNHWDELIPLTMIKGRKIIRLDATIAGVKFADIVTNAADPAMPNGRSSLFGNQVLNHFNVILDNKEGFIYLNPNTRFNEPYSDYQKYLEDISKTKKSSTQ